MPLNKATPRSRHVFTRSRGKTREPARTAMKHPYFALRKALINGSILPSITPFTLLTSVFVR